MSSTPEAPATLNPPTALKIDLSHMKALPEDMATVVQPGSAVIHSPKTVPAQSPIEATPVQEEAAQLSAPKSSTKTAWTPEEDIKLLETIERLGGPKDWSRIAAELPHRKGKQCRERWHNHLSPEVKKEEFSAEEDRRITEAVAEHGPKWAQLVKLIPGRTDNAIKNRWNSTTRRIVRMQARLGGKLPGPMGDIDLNTLDASSIAKHLLQHGMPQLEEKPPPEAKRKLTLNETAAVSTDGADRTEATAQPRPTKRRRAVAPPRIMATSAVSSVSSSGLDMLRVATLGRSLSEYELAASLLPDAPPAALEVSSSPSTSSSLSASSSGGAGTQGGAHLALDGLALLACSSAGSANVPSCHSPRVLEAALALGGSLAGDM